MSLRSQFRYNFHIETMFVSWLPLVVCRRAHVLFTLCVFVWCMVVSSTYCVLFFVLFVIVLCHVYSCQFLSNLDSPFLIVPLVFSNVYLLSIVCPVSCVPSGASFSFGVL